MEIAGLVFFVLILLAGVIVIPFGIAGTFIIVADALVLGLLTSFERLSLSFIAILLGLTIFVEVVEALLGAVMASRFGGSKVGMAGAMVGGLIGAILGTPVTPVVGTLLGGFLGAFFGATLFEYIRKPELRSAARVGLGALIGAMGGKMTKLLIAVLMVVITLIEVF